MANERQEIVDLADELHSAAIHLLRRVRAQDRTTGVGPAQLSALSVLVFGGAMSLSRLSGIEQVKPPTMVRIVRGLGERKLAATRTDPADARRLRISATPKGRTLMQQARARRVQTLADMLAQRPKAELKHLRQAVKIIKSLMTAD
jgi:DNA-binding MarR family transcriptional regulator